MEKKSVNPKDFWEERIIGWEKSRYDYPTKNHPFIERWAGLLSHSLRHRISIARNLIIPFIVNKRVVELGCGSGILAEDFVKAGAKEYIGVDIAEIAIQSAVKRFVSSKYASQIRFQRADIITELKSMEADFVFSLGLLDWFEKDDLKIIFEKTNEIDFLHSISEKKPWALRQILHRIYVYMAYGHTTASYVPRYYDIAVITKIAKPYFQKPINIYRNRELGFGAFLTTLPLGR
ncbi:MAG: class I SAM-dependent methyltransferase [Nitrospirae bacterium]|nr:class I SAM-dependent methyltransferase [Nitrospirota bacterium]